MVGRCESWQSIYKDERTSAHVRRSIDHAKSPESPEIGRHIEPDDSSQLLKGLALPKVHT